jgi:hypothetical protein
MNFRFLSQTSSISSSKPSKNKVFCYVRWPKNSLCPCHAHVHVHVHAACPRLCCMPCLWCMPMSMLHTHVQAAYPHVQFAWPCLCCMAWICSMDIGVKLNMGMQQRHGHTACTGTCSVDMDMQYGYRYGHAARAWTLTCSMNMNVDKQHVFVHAACLCPRCMSMSMLHVHVYPAWPSPYCLSMSMLHGLAHAALIWSRSTDIDIQQKLGMQHGQWHAACTGICSRDLGMALDMQHVLYLSMFMQHGHGHALCPNQCCKSRSKRRVHVHTASPCLCCMSISMLHVVLAAWPCPWCISMFIMQAFD